MQRLHPGSQGASNFALSGQPLAIVAAVMILGASIYLWRRRYIRSRAAFITIAAIIGVLLYLGFFVAQPPT